MVDRRDSHHDMAASRNRISRSYENGATLAPHWSTSLMREAVAIGAIHIRRTEVRPFTEKQIALLKTFADQAVIAIENVRLFKELEERNAELREALEHQTATGEVLGIISRSPTDVQPVLDAIVESAARVCGIDDVLLRLREGNVMVPRAHFGPIPTGRVEISIDEPQYRWMREHGTLHIPDVRAQNDFPMLGSVSDFAHLLGRSPSSAGGTHWNADRTSHRGAPLHPGADQASRNLRRPGGDRHRERPAVPRTRSADTRVDTVGRGIKGVGRSRPGGQLHARSRDRAHTIVGHAVQLSGTNGGVIYEYDEATQEFLLRASYHMEEEVVEALQATPVRLGEGATGRTATMRTPVQVPNIIEGREYTAARARPMLTRLGYRSVLAVPLLREERILGALTVWRREAGSFSPEVVNLLQTFATQSVLAIQNARLFREIEDKSRQIEAANRHKSEFLANMSHELRTPLNAIIGFSEVLGERLFGELNEKQAEYTDDILSSGRHLLSLINEILDLPRSRPGAWSWSWLRSISPWP